LEPIELWAAVSFTAQNGRTEELLLLAAENGVYLYEVSPCPCGFYAHCAAMHYRRLAVLARKCRVSLHVERRHGVYFRLRPLLRRTGLWVGVACFVPLLLWFQSVIWYIDCSDLTVGQQARVLETLRTGGQIQIGQRVTEELLTAGEYSLLESGEFSWASLNFSRGRLTVEVTAAKAVPEIASPKLQGLHARESGTVYEIDLQSGTALVTLGQEVTAGEELIGTARSERDGTLIFEPTAGSVLMRFTREDSYAQALNEEVILPTGKSSVKRTYFFLGHSFQLPQLLQSKVSSLFHDDEETSAEPQTVTRHFGLELFGEPLPISVEEVTAYPCSTQTLTYTEAQATDLARLHCLQALYEDYPDAVCVARTEHTEISDNTLYYTVSYVVIADVCG
jgi:similar to stage IV sporulation protein